MKAISDKVKLLQTQLARGEDTFEYVYWRR